MAAKLPNPGPCPFAGFQTEGPPIGDDGFDSDGIDWYTVSPPHAKFNKHCGIVYFSDAKGIWHNSRVLADQFAYAGYYVVVIKHRGVARAEGTEFRPETTEEENNRPSSADVDAMAEHAMGWLKARGCDRIGAVGYSVGGVPILLRSTNTNFFTAAFLAHPISTSRHLFAAVTIPVSVAFADNDNQIGRAARGAAEAGLLASGAPYQITIYSHVHHGFACRRAFTTEAEVFAKKQAFIQAITWMDEHLYNAPWLPPTSPGGS